MKTTKELAKELGLLRKRQRSVTSPDQHKNKRSRQLSRQIFHYIIVLDYESTCWSNTKLIPQEIIEFPAVLMNTSNGEIESQFHSYIQPTEKPILSEFCRQLTGISQDQVDDGIPLQFCLKRFSLWLENLFKEKNIQYFSTPEQNSKLCTFVTWSDWDLGVCLKNECRRKQLRKPPELNQWIDLRATYKKFYERKPNGLNGALNDLGITFQGREHSGLDDARNTARLAWRMIKDGCVLTITKRLSGPGIVGSHKLPRQTKEMPTLENDPQGNYIPNKKTLARNEDSKSHSPIQTTSANIKKKNSPIGQKTSEKNTVRKGSELSVHPEIPGPSLRSIGRFVSSSHKENSIEINADVPESPNSNISESTWGRRALASSSPRQKKSCLIQIKKKFSVYTDDKTSDTNIKEDFGKNLSTTYELNRNNNNNSKHLSIPSCVLKEKSNAFNEPNSSYQKLENLTENQTPSFALKDNSSSFITPNSSYQKLKNTENQTPSFALKDKSNDFIETNSSNQKLGNSIKNQTLSLTIKDKSNGLINQNSSYQKLKNFTENQKNSSALKDNSNSFITPNSYQILKNSSENQTLSFTVKDNSKAFMTPNSSYQKLETSTKNQISFLQDNSNLFITPNSSNQKLKNSENQITYSGLKDNSNPFITPNSSYQKLKNSSENQTPSFTVKNNSKTFKTPNSLPLKPKIINHCKVPSKSSSGIKDVTNVFITPNSLPPKKFNNNPNLSYPNSHCSKMKSTPPLCKCGRRAKLCISHTPGANMGKKFFTCGLKGSNSKSKTRTVIACNFFKWELSHQSRVSVLNRPSQTSFSSLSTPVSISAVENNENQNSCSSFLKKSPVESTPVLKRNKVRPYQLSL